jgi:hypothetical protein
MIQVQVGKTVQISVLLVQNEVTNHKNCELSATLPALPKYVVHIFNKIFIIEKCYRTTKCRNAGVAVLARWKKCKLKY